jgi:tetratricopeptide (TPR) repeat protein
MAACTWGDQIGARTRGRIRDQGVLEGNDLPCIRSPFEDHRGTGGEGTAIMKILISMLLLLAALPYDVQSAAADSARRADTLAGERLGTVSFPVSCSPGARAPFSRGVALLHDFWYDEAQRQFEQIAKTDPACAMAHWGIAMSVFHQIWDRPDEQATARGWSEMLAARAAKSTTAREREYIAALSGFFRPDQRDYQSRIDGYAAAMAKLYRNHPGDVDAGAFYALSLLAAEAPDDASLAQNHKAMAVLNPLFARSPDHPGVVHYIIHACDTPLLAPDGLRAALHYGKIAASAPHAVHMPGHVFARLGMWQADIKSNLASVAASKAAEARHQSGAMDQFHSDDFLLYAFLQIGRDADAKTVLQDSAASLAAFESMGDMGEHYMDGMFPYYRTKLPVFFNLEMRDWKSAAALEPVAGARPETQTMTYWARTVAAGHLRQPEQARVNLAEYDSLIHKVREGRHAYLADSTGARIERGEMLGWIAFADANPAEALKRMRESADLQDKVGQGEVDIPAREMLADMLLELGRPQEALDEYRRALKLSPNRFNGLYNAGMAAEAAGDGAQARLYYAALLKSTDSGAHSARPEFDHAKAFTASTARAD